MGEHDTCGCKENGLDCCNSETCTCSNGCSKEEDSQRSKRVIAPKKCSGNQASINLEKSHVQ